MTPVFYVVNGSVSRYNNTWVLHICQPKDVNSLKMLKRVRGMKTLEEKKNLFCMLVATDLTNRLVHCVGQLRVWHMRKDKRPDVNPICHSTRKIICLRSIRHVWDKGSGVGRKYPTRE